MKLVRKASFACLLALLVLCMGMMTAMAEKTITLPAGLKVIKEEAFLNATGIENVVVPEGAVEIGPRAFAGASVKHIRIPASVTVIADDAFQSVTGLTVRGEEGSFAQVWCAAHGVPFTSKDPEPYPESAHPYAYNTDQTWTWQGNAATKWLRITFSKQTYMEHGYDNIYIHDAAGNLVGTYTGNNLAGRTIAVSGNSFSLRLVTDDYNNKYGFAIANIEERVDAFEQPIAIKAIRASSANVSMGGSVTWTVEAESAFTPIRYEYVVMFGDQPYTYGTANQPQATIELWQYGSATLYLAAYDAAGNVTMAVSDPVKVLPPSLSIDRIEANVTATEVGKTIQWSIGITNSAHLLSWELAVLRDGIEVERLANDTYLYQHKYVPMETGVYTLVLTVADTAGATFTATSAPVTVTEATAAPAEDFEYYLNHENKAVISDYYGTDAYLIIPDTIDGYPVVGIGNKAFTSYYGSYGPVKYKGNDYIQVVVIPDSVDTIDEDAFRACPNLRLVELGNGVQTIGEEAFAECVKLERMDFPSSVTTLRWGAFADCTSLAEITYPAGLGQSGYSDPGPFHGCTSLKKVVVPEGITVLPGGIFQGVTNLKTVVLPNSLTLVGGEAFEDCTSLEKITLPENVTSVGDRAFAGCTSLTEVNMPDFMQSLGQELFDGCTSLRTFRLPMYTYQGKTVGIGGPATFLGTTQLTLIFPEGCTEFRYEQFWGTPGSCDGIVGVELPSTLETIGVRAFADCANLATVKLREGLRVIEGYAFENCTSIRSIRLPNSLKEISPTAFDGCGSLQIKADWGSEGYKFAQDNGLPCEYLTASGTYAPEGQLPLGKDFSFLGFVRSSETISRLFVGIYNSDGTKCLQSVTWLPNDTIARLVKLNDELDFTTLPVGRYLFRMTATAGSMTKTLAETTFDIVPKDAHAITSDMASPSGIYTEGDEFIFKGRVTLFPTAGYLTVSIIEEATNKTVRIYCPQQDVLTFYLSDAQAEMRFAQLTPGAYTYRVVATMANKEYLVEETHFRIASSAENLQRAAKVDAGFKSNSGTVNNDLLYESIILANASYSSNKAFSNLAALGFQNVKSYSLAPGVHTIGHYIGWKDVVDSAGNVSRVYAIVCRGTKVDSANEWLSNFTFTSSTGYHDGFYLAAQEVLADFKAYVQEHAAPGERKADAKVWIMGHSRGGAVANMLGGAFLVNEGYSRTNVFTYTFACPNVYMGQAASATNVFNYNIGGDFVPRVPLTSWGFTRYGSTVTLRNDDQEFGVSLTDMNTMDRLEEWLSEIERVEALQQAMTKIFEGTDVFSLDKAVLVAIGAAIEVSYSAQDDQLLWKDAAELFKDIGPTHDSQTYIKWISSITGR